MKIANIDREILHNFWTTWGISMKFSGKMCLMIILKVTKKQGFIIIIEDTFFEKPQGGVKLTAPSPPPPSPPAVLGLNVGRLWGMKVTYTTTVIFNGHKYQKTENIGLYAATGMYTISLFAIIVGKEGVGLQPSKNWIQKEYMTFSFLM